MGIIGQFDEQLHIKGEQAREAKEKLLGSYSELLADMTGLLSKATETGTGLAETSFLSKRRDFVRFLERAQARSYESDGDTAMVDQFRRFCLNWLNVFKECSIDPINAPLIIVKKEELDDKHSIVDLCDFLLTQVKAVEVAFCTNQRNRDTGVVQDNQNSLKRLSLHPGSKQMAITNGDPETGEKQTAMLEEEGSSTPKRTSWIRCCGKFDVDDSSDYPKQCNCGCFSILFLSPEHVKLISLFFMGLLTIGVIAYQIIKNHQAGVKTDEAGVKNDEAGVDAASAVMGVLVIIIQMVLVVVLIFFEDLDIVIRLEAEVRALQDQNEQLQRQREKMKEFWTNAQNLTEMWLYRTVPRLDLYQEVHKQLEDEEDDKNLLHNITGFNQALEHLESKLGAIEAWRGDGELKTSDKKLFGNELSKLVQITDSTEMIQSIQDRVNNGSVMKTLENLPQAGFIQQKKGGILD